MLETFLTAVYNEEILEKETATFEKKIDQVLYFVIFLKIFLFEPYLF